MQVFAWVECPSFFALEQKQTGRGAPRVRPECAWDGLQGGGKRRPYPFANIFPRKDGDPTHAATSTHFPGVTKEKSDKLYR